MSGGKYEGGVLAGIRNGAIAAAGRLFPWPEELPDLGRRGGPVPFTRCADCPRRIHIAVAGTFTIYGRRPLCLGCVRRRLRDLPREGAA